MDQLNLQSEEQKWLLERTEAVCAAGRARQRTEAERFQQRQAEDEATWRLLKFAGFVFLLCLAILLIAFMPIFWDALTHYLHRGEAALLLSVVAAPRLPALAHRVTCRYCEAGIPVVGTPKPLTDALIDEHSDGCICRLSTRILKGLVAGSPVALCTFETFKMRWHIKLGVCRERAQDYCNLLCRVPLPESFAEAIASELARRSDVVAQRED